MNDRKASPFSAEQLWGAPNLDMNSRLVTWQNTKKQLDRLKAVEMAQREELALTIFPNPIIGTNNFDLGGGYVLKYVKKLNYNLATKDDSAEVDRALGLIEQSAQDGKFIADRLVKWKPELMVSEYKKMTERQQEMLSDALTISVAAPELKIEEPKVK